MCDKLIIVYINARSVKSVRSNINKITKMHNVMHKVTYQPRLLAVTMVTKTFISNIELFPHNYVVRRRDRTLFLSKNLQDLTKIHIHRSHGTNQYRLRSSGAMCHGYGYRVARCMFTDNAIISPRRFKLVRNEGCI